MYEMKKRCPVCGAVVVAEKINCESRLGYVVYKWRATCKNSCFYTKLFDETIRRNNDGILECEPDGFNELVKFWEESV